jgi:manganese transport protein
LMSNLMAILLQILSAKLGIATGKSLSENCRTSFSTWANILLWITAELAAIATDLAEFLGAAVGFELLFSIPLWAGALITGVCVLIILALERLGFRKVELVIIILVSIIALAYVIELVLVQPNASDLFHGMFVPMLPAGSTLVAVGIVGATVMYVEKLFGFSCFLIFTFFVFFSVLFFL